MTPRDPFADSVARMRREMDALFGDTLERSGVSRRAGRWPAIDVAYAAHPPRALVTVEIAGMRASEIELHVEPRRLVIAGHRGAPSPEGEVYQQIEIERGPFRRVVELGADVDPDAVRARYEDGMLRIELPLLARSGRARAVPIERGEDG